MEEESWGYAGVLKGIIKVLNTSGGKETFSMVEEWWGFRQWSAYLGDGARQLLLAWLVQASSELRHLNGNGINHFEGASIFSSWFS
jgi:hypothetical protein